MTLSASIRAAIATQFSKSLDLGSPSAAPTLALVDSLADGITNDQADMVWADTRDIPLSDDEDLDFGTTGGLLDVFGDPFEPAEIVAVQITAAAGNTNNVVVGAAAAEPFLGPMGGTAPTTTLKPGASLQWYAPAGWAVANNTNDKLKVANSGAGTPVTYSIIVVGRSA